MELLLIFIVSVIIGGMIGSAKGQTAAGIIGKSLQGPLLEWMEAKRAKAQKVIPPGANARRVAIAEAIIAVARAFEAEAITREQYFDQTTELVEATGDKEILTGWIQNQFDWLCESFPNIADAWKEHPQRHAMAARIGEFPRPTKATQTRKKLTLVPTKTNGNSAAF